MSLTHATVEGDPEEITAALDEIEETALLLTGIDAGCDEQKARLFDIIQQVDYLRDRLRPVAGSQPSETSQLVAALASKARPQ